MSTAPELLLISAMLRTKDHVLPASRGINSNMFHAYREEYAWIEEYIGLHGRTPSTGAFRSAFEDVPIKKVDDVEHFCEAVRENNSRVVLQQGLHSVIAKLKAGDVKSAIEQLSSASVAAEASFLGHGTDGDIFRDYKDIKAEVLKRKKRAKDTGYAGIPTGFPTLDELTGGFQPGWMVVVTARTGVGKALPDKTGVLTPSGYTPIGKIQTGDKVFGSNGKTTDVIGVYPQGEKRVYEVVFSDDSVVEACEDHLWTVQAAGKPWKVQTTKQIEEWTGTTDQRYAVPALTVPVEFQNSGRRPLSYDPYKLGLILGDGHIRAEGSVTFSSPDQELIAAFGSSAAHYAKYDYGISKMAPVMRRLGLAGKRSHDKFVPQEYLFASPQKRHAILQGLLDTDGSARKPAGGVEYSTTSEQLAKDVQFLCESLGGYARIVNRQTYFTYKGAKKPGKPSYRLTVVLPPQFPPFRLARKLADYNPRTKYQPKRTIKEVRRTDRYESMTCIAVSAIDSLFVTEHAILTHNTRSLVRMACAATFSGFTSQYDALEQTRPEIAMQVHAFASSEFGKGVLRSIDLAQGNGYETKKYLEFLRQMSSTVQGKFHVADNSRGGMTPSTIAAQIERNRADIVFLDQLSLMDGADDWQSITALSTAIKRLATRYQVPIVTAAQINRAGAGSKNQGVENIANADRIGQDADLVINVQKFSKSVVSMRVVKFRHGPEGQIFYLKFDPNMGVMEEITYEEAADLKDQDDDNEEREKERTFKHRKKGSFHEAALAAKTGKKTGDKAGTAVRGAGGRTRHDPGPVSRATPRAPVRGSAGRGNSVRLKRRT